MTVFLAVFAGVFLAILAAVAVIFLVAGSPELEAQETPIADDVPNDFAFEDIVAAQRPDRPRSI